MVKRLALVNDWVLKDQPTTLTRVLHGVLAAMLAALIGLTAWSGHTFTLSVAIFFPAAWALSPSRRWAFVTALAYYLAAARGLPQGAAVFFGPAAGLPAGILLWLGSSAALSLPWGLLWHPTVRAWRCPLALALSAVPPLGVIGWASPLTAAGAVFPTTGWLGVVLCVVVLSAMAQRPRVAPVGLVFCGLGWSSSFVPAPPPGWVGLDTHVEGPLPLTSVGFSHRLVTGLVDTLFFTRGSSGQGSGQPCPHGKG